MFIIYINRCGTDSTELDFVLYANICRFNSMQLTEHINSLMYIDINQPDVIYVNVRSRSTRVVECCSLKMTLSGLA